MAFTVKKGWHFRLVTMALRILSMAFRIVTMALRILSMALRIVTMALLGCKSMTFVP